jgi:hypothetical protein
MKRLLLLAVVLIPSAAIAQDKPTEKPKAPPRIAIDDPAKLKDDADFPNQGEYAGELATADGKSHKFGAHVVALGAGKFDLVLYSGGLPGEGWDGKSKTEGKMARLRAGGTPSRDPAAQLGGGIDGDSLTIEDSAGTKGTLKKVTRKSSTLGAEPPKGAVVLFAKEGDEKNWTGGKLVELSDGKFLGNGIKSKQAFGSFTMHVEFRLPWMPNSRGQGRANSGVYLQDRYEVQVLDSFGLKGLNNECGGIYTQHAPKVNMCYPPMAWQTYDVDFTAATFDGEKKVKPARTTIKHNGVVIQDDVELKGPTGGGQPETDKPGPIQLQNHGDPVVYRNIWVVEKK